MKKLKLFDMNRDGKGVSKDEKPLKPTLWNLPKFYFRHFTKVLNLNFVMLPIWIIPFVLVYLYTVADSIGTQTNVVYSTLYGISVINPTPGIMSLIGVFGSQLPLQTYGPGRIIVSFALILLLAVLWGWINLGATYCARGIFRGDPVFIWSDFKYAVSRNLWQGLLIGILDFAACCILGYDLFYFAQRGGTFWLDFFFFGICGAVAIYFFMRFYIYLLLVTFDIKTGKLIKNSLIFSILGIKRNLIGLLAIFIVIALNVALVLLFWSVQFVVPLILPIIYLLPSIVLFTVYSAYPVIDRYMIKGRA
ncbi:MAG: hypothetical protein MJ137_00710 [Clostridia bacterium]|nr:hypothetical protein [Clostridia bacterium]